MTDDVRDGGTDDVGAGADAAAEPTDDRGAVKALGEVALRVENFEAMREFYLDVVGLAPIGDFERSVFFGLGESYGGHEQVFVLFDRTADPTFPGLDPDRTTVDHVAFTVDAADFDSETERLWSHGLELEFAYHDWVEWRSLYFADPEGNTVEFVCYDPKGERRRPEGSRGEGDGADE